MAMKGSRAPEEILDAKKRLELLGFGATEIITLGQGRAPETATVVRIKLGPSLCRNTSGKRRRRPR